VREQDNRSTGGFRSQVVFEPFQLVRTKLAQPLQGSDIHQSHEVDALLIEAVPASPFAALAVSFQILFSIVDGNIVLAGNIEHLFLRTGENPFRAVELSGLGRMTYIAGVDDELRRLRKSVDLIDRCLQRTSDICVSRLVETDVAVADLDEVQIALGTARHLLAESL